MGKRDLDIIIGADVDRQSFARAKQRTQGFLNRLKSSAGGMGGGASSLDKSAQLLGKLGQAAAVIAAVRVAADGIQAAGKGFAAHAAAARGDMEEAAKQYREMFNDLRNLPLGLGDLVRVFESIESFVTGRQAIEGMFTSIEEGEKKRKELLDKNAAARRAAVQVEQEIADIRETAGLKGLELEAARYDQQTFRRIRQLEEIAKTTSHGPARRRLEQGIQDFQSERYDAFKQMLDLREADEKALAEKERKREEEKAQRENEAMEARIKRAEIASENEKRLFGLDGMKRAQEMIRIQSEARVRELEELKAIAKSAEHRLRIENLIGETIAKRDREITEVGRVRPGAAPARPGIVSGRLLTGAAQSTDEQLLRVAMEANRRRAEEARAADRQRKENTGLMQQLVQFMLANPRANVGGLLQ